MLNRLNQWSEWFISPRKQPIVCAVSGGMDSMVLLDVLMKMGIEVKVAHVNYGLRGQESDGDEAFVRQFCEENQLEFFLKKVHFDPANKENIQVWARNERQAFFRKLYDGKVCKWIALGHHKSDQLETTLLSVFKGYDIQKMSNIGYIYIRPLLDITKAEIIEYAEQNNVKYRTDSSNLSNKYDRNFLRNEIIPKLRDRFENFDERVLGLVNRQKIRNNIAYSTISEKLKELTTKVRPTPHSFFYEKISKAFLKYPYGKHYLHYDADFAFHFSRSQIDQIIESKNYQAKFEAGPWLVVHDEEFIYRGYKEKPEWIDDIKLNPPDHSPYFESSINQQKSIDFEDGKLYLDLDKVKLPFIVRYMKEGDKIKPLGMHKGSKSLNKFLKEKGFNFLDRYYCLVLEDQNGVVAVPKAGIDERHAIDENTENILVLKSKY